MSERECFPEKHGNYSNCSGIAPFTNARPKLLHQNRSLPRYSPHPCHIARVHPHPLFPSRFQSRHPSRRPVFHRRSSHRRARHPIGLRGARPSGSYGSQRRAGDPIADGAPKRRQPRLTDFCGYQPTELESTVTARYFLSCS
ncbi:hypothetical protein GQ55_3G489000 [Panicum hallii var. hallii]|uniref:Uncharacterized protein n=1 Tax=Panicum hallii var. hallii TaxID=1504633 RepID=A0A2T7EJX3_9POAL|nr:hypothetical protein GQ55_3G489000 [Panicum hallii var. hallii]PUZ68107.1 hypothetical protein GQ55_3G489000 [Panicum hallii var. hallii]PUZ68108.1 hypothetical protein GQ55_3G489000 [Panicum hallii var. hallii]